MSTHNKPSNTTTSNHSKRSQVDHLKVLEIVNNSIDKLLPTGCEDVVFIIPGNLRRYRELQNKAFGTKKRISYLVSFTSAGVGPDAWAVPTIVYVRHTWGLGGLKVLQAVDAALGGTEVSARISEHCCVHVTVKESNVHLKIQGPRDSFAKVVEQICWLVSVAGDTSLDRLAKYLEETKQGSTPRSYSETIYTGRPVINRDDGNRLRVSFQSRHAEQRANTDLVAFSGQCWKAITGFSIIASGFTVPPRPRQCSGLEASLPVLRQLLKRGCYGRSLLLSDKPLVMFSPLKGEVGDKMRLIFAAGSEKHENGSAIYWHFDPAKHCDSEETYQRIESQVRVDSRIIRPTSRHFVGWSNNAGLSLAQSGLVFSDLRRRPHLELIVPTVTATLLIPGVGSVSGSLATEKVQTTANTDKMSTDNGLLTVSGRLFILWEPTGRRGWLVHGDTVALILLREYLRAVGKSRVDFYSLKGVNDPSVSAYEVLSDIENLTRVYWPPKDAKEKPEASDKEEAAEVKDRKQKLEKIIADAMEGIYASLVEMSNLTVDLKKRSGLSGPITKWFQEKLSTSVKGWDFWTIPNRKVAHIYLHKLRTNPGWIHMAKELEATFLFAEGIGDILEPRVGSCCRYFPTLPKGHNFLAAGMKDMRKIILQYGGPGPADRTLARLNHDQAWERRIHPFKRPGCQGDHLDNLQPCCFPVQGFKNARVAEDPWKRQERDRSLLEDKELNVYTKGEILAMADEYPNGVVVFGRQPGVEELRDIYQRSHGNRDSGTEAKDKATPTVASYSNKPSSSGSSQNLPDPKARSSTVEIMPSQARTAMQPPRTGSQQRTPSLNSERSTGSASGASGISDSQRRQPMTPSAQRTPSTASIRSTGSNVQARASGTDRGALYAHAAIVQSPAASIRQAASNASLRCNRSTTHPNTTQDSTTGAGPLQASASRSPATSIQKAASDASLRSIGSNGRPKVLQDSSTGAGQLRASAPQSPATSIHKAASKASLWSTISTTRSVATSSGDGRSHESSAIPSVPTAARKASNSSIRTTSSVASKASDDSRLQKSSQQVSDAALKKTNTNSSHNSASSHSSRAAQNMAAFSSNLQRNQMLQQISQVTSTASDIIPGQHVSSNHGKSSTSGTDSHHATSGPVAGAGGGPGGSS